MAGYDISWWELPEMLKPVIREVEPHRVRQLGRWLARHSPDRNPVRVGLALLEETAGSLDINVLQSLAVIGDVFSPAVVRVVERLPEHEQVLLWIARRTQGWARVDPVEALCGTADPNVRAWLLRHAVMLDVLSGYYAGKIATNCDLRTAIEGHDADDELLDGAGRILMTMTHCSGMGLTLRHYDDAVPVLMRYLELAERAEPTVWRFHHTAVLAAELRKESAAELHWQPGRLQQVRDRYAALIRTPSWITTFRSALNDTDPDSDHAWLAEYHRTLLDESDPTIPAGP